MKARESACHPISARRLLGLLLAASIAVAVSAPATAAAHWTRVARTRTASSPYFVCPTAPGPRCALIEDPVLGGRRRGELPAGAITKGPVQEVSPALEGGGMEGGYDPEDLQGAYAMPSAAQGTGQTVAVVDAEDDPDAEADLAKYRSQYGLPACSSSDGCFRKVDAHGGSEYPTEKSAEWSAEISMDLDMVSAVCPNCHILLVEARPEQSALAEAQNEAVALGATEISDSYVSASSSMGDSEAADYDHPGVPITAAAGDECYGVAVPAADPNVIAVGGTSLHRPGNRWSESVWHEESGGKCTGTGSGCSTEPKPTWQKDEGCAYRTINDVAAVADPNTPVSVYDSYSEPGKPWRLEGGTSVATPIVAAAMALAEPYVRSFDGAHALYLADEEHPGEFRDVVSGSDGTCTPPPLDAYLCTATSGYDGPTGLGSPHGALSVAPPEAISEPASSATTAGATLHGTVDANGGEVTSCEFEYGPTSAYGSDAACSSLPSGTGAVAVSATVAGLVSGETYHYRLVIAYRGGSVEGDDATFQTLAAPPTLLALGASGTTTTGATLHAEVDPNGTAVSTCAFEYGTSSSYGSSVPCSSSPGAGREPVAVSAELGGLAALTTYHFRVVVSGPAGTAASDDETFSTMADAPATATSPPSSVTETSAVLGGAVDPEGAATSCVFEFEGGDIPCAPAPGAGVGLVAVSAAVSGLQPGGSYAYRVVAANGTGTTYGNIVTFTTPSPPAPAPPSPSQARLVATSLVANSHGVLQVRVGCAGGAAPCAGTITLRTASPVRVASRGATGRQVVVLGKARFQVTAGKVTTLSLHLTATALRLLARTRTLHVRAAVVLPGATGAEAKTQVNVTIRASAALRPHR